MKGLTLTTKEQNRLQVLNGVLGRLWPVRTAAEVLGVSERQVWRLLAAYLSRFCQSVTLPFLRFCHPGARVGSGALRCCVSGRAVAGWTGGRMARFPCCSAARRREPMLGFTARPLVDHTAG